MPGAAGRELADEDIVEAGGVAAGPVLGDEEELDPLGRSATNHSTAKTSTAPRRICTGRET
jgi:hypothetical protein